MPPVSCGWVILRERLEPNPSSQWSLVPLHLFGNAQVTALVGFGGSDPVCLLVPKMSSLEERISRLGGLREGGKGLCRAGKLPSRGL